MVDSIIKLIIRYKIREAFWEAAEGVSDDADKQSLFLQILRFRNNVAMLQPDSGRIREQAEHGGDPYMAYAFARLHDVLQTEEDSDKVKEMYYTIAANHGIGDAYAFLAYMHRDGDLGEQDMDGYRTLMQKARQMRSGKAVQQTIRDLIYGSGGAEADPAEAHGLAEKCLEELGFPDPAYYQLMAEADLQLGRKADAVRNFESAAQYGFSSAFYWWAVTGCCDDEGNITDRRRFMEIMQKGIDVYSADCFLMQSLLLDDVSYEALDEEDRKEAGRSILNDLETGWLLGDSECPHFLADYFENGRYGFERDYGKAWLWYRRGAILRNPACYEALSRMILDDGTAPSSYDEGYAYECAYKGLLLGSEDLLEVAVRGYRNGFLAHHAAMMESKWLPKYEEEVAEMMYDGDPEREIEED